MTALLTACLFFEILVHVMQKHARKLCSATLSAAGFKGIAEIQWLVPPIRRACACIHQNNCPCSLTDDDEYNYHDSSRRVSQGELPIGFAFSTSHDWLKTVAPFFHPIRSKTKPNCDSLVHFFARFASTSCIYF